MSSLKRKHEEKSAEAGVTALVSLNQRLARLSDTVASADRRIAHLEKKRIETKGTEKHGASLFKHKDHHASIRAVVVNVAVGSQLAALVPFTNTDAKDWTVDREALAGPYGGLMASMRSCNGAKQVIFGVKHLGPGKGLRFFDKSGLLDGAGLRVGHVADAAGRMGPDRICVVKIAGYDMYTFTKKVLESSQVLALTMDDIQPDDESEERKLIEDLMPLDVFRRPADIPKDFEDLMDEQGILFVLDSANEFADLDDFREGLSGGREHEGEGACHQCGGKETDKGEADSD